MRTTPSPCDSPPLLSNETAFSLIPIDLSAGADLQGPRHTSGDEGATLDAWAGSAASSVAASDLGIRLNPLSEQSFLDQQVEHGFQGGPLHPESAAEIMEADRTAGFLDFGEQSLQH
jgi:hypothetical protein